MDEWSSRRRPLPDNTHNTHMPPVGFEPTISAGERPQTYALDRAATGTGSTSKAATKFTICSWPIHGGITFVSRVKGMPLTTTNKE